MHYFVASYVVVAALPTVGMSSRPFWDGGFQTYFLSPVAILDLKNTANFMSIS
jgi:hypothetical protein